MKLGILGTGMIVKDFMQTIDELNFEDVSVLSSTRSYDRSVSMLEEHGYHKVYTDYDEMLRSDVDTIYVALPNHLHYEFSKKALEANKNVILEKPFTSNYKEACVLASLAKEKGLIIIEAMTVHYMPAMKELKADLNKLGAIKIVSTNYSQYSSRYDKFKAGEILPAFDYHKSGGALYDLNVYNIHFILSLFGKPNDVDYIANVEKGIDTSGIMTLDYGTFKAVAIGAKDCKAPLMNTIQGDEGNVVISTPVSRMRDYVLADNKGEEEHKSFDEIKHGMFYEFKEMKSIIENKDFDKANEMLEISLNASEVMTKAREKAGIRFDAD